MCRIRANRIPITALAATLLVTAPARADDGAGRSTTDLAAPMLTATGNTPLQIPAGQSRLLTTETAPGTIIVGDDSIAAATLGAADSIILTGQSAGKTNVIVLDDQGAVLTSALIAVVPVAGALRSEVLVHRGAADRERYECRGTRCAPVAEAATETPDPDSTEAAAP